MPTAHQQDNCRGLPPSAAPLADGDFFAALAARLPAAENSEIQLLPAGAFRSGDGSGRPADVAAWKIDAGIAAKLAAELAARKTPLVIDYEHQTLLAAQNGQPAPAAGWIDAVEWREGQGLFGKVRWTDKAAAMIAAGEYQFISPVFSYQRPGGEITGLAMAALVNAPGLTGMQAVALAAAFPSSNYPQETPTVDLTQLLKTLGLPETDSEEKALAAIAALKTQAAELAAAQDQLAALKAKQPEPTAPDPALLKLVGDLQNEVALLKAGGEAQTAEALLKAAKDAGKIISASLENWLKTQPVAILKGVLDNLTPIPATQGMQSATAKPDQEAALKSTPPTAEVAAFLKASGMTMEEFQKGKVA